MDYADLNLKENPFKDITPTPGQIEDNFVWAGMPMIKNKIEDVYKDAKKFSSRQVILNWGPWGGGKTFSAYYFINKNKQSSISQAYIRSPKDGGKSTEEFFYNIIDYITFSAIKRQVQDRIKTFGEAALRKTLNSKIRSEEFTSAIILLADADDEIGELMQRYVYSGLTKTELKKTGLPRNIESGTDYIKFLSGIILCFLGDSGNLKGKFILWIDEMEDLIYFSQKNYRAFSQILRDLIDTLNEDFTVFFNFTLAEPQESTIELILGGALWSRISKKIRFKDLSEDDALLYCSELIHHYQTSKNKPTYHPFNEEILRVIFGIIPQGNLTPRDINKYCGSFLNYAIKKNKNVLDQRLLKDWSDKIAEDE
jgi:hypothetical protein